MVKRSLWEGTDFSVTEKPKLMPPSLYHVILNNDDYTPMDFVVDVLKRFFSMDMESAIEVMLKVHHEGKAVCGTYTADIAEMKVMQVMLFAKENEHPLLCTMQKS